MYCAEDAEEEAQQPRKKMKTEAGSRKVTERRLRGNQKKFIKFEKKMARKARGKGIEGYRPTVERFDPVFGQKIDGNVGLSSSYEFSE